MSKPIYIFDLDGTLANIDHRLHHITGETKDWDAFFDACRDDQPIPEMMELMDALSGVAEIWIVTGRSDQVRQQTALWFCKHGVVFDKLLMRKHGDHRPDHVIKQEFLSRMSDEERSRIQLVFEDRDRVVQMWRENDLRCLQVAPGDF